MVAQRLKLGRFFGIELFVHWTFGLLLAYVAYSAHNEGGSIWMVGFSVSLLLAVFLCVTLHEYGHSLAARRYGVETVDITLLPIGGVARLKRIPRIPIQELVIAVAGPAVNVVIASVLGAALAGLVGVGPLFNVTVESMGFTTGEVQVESVKSAEPTQPIEPLTDISDLSLESAVLSFAVFVVAINVWLVLFNLIPAFPMDGGRVLRSVLAMFLPYVTATRWAQRVGVVCGALMAMFAISSDPPRLSMLAIAAFIMYAGRMEANQVEISEQLHELTAGDVMIRRPPAVSMDWNLAQVQQWWQDQPSSSAAVVGLGNVVVGMLTLRDLSKQVGANANNNANLQLLTAGQITDHNALIVESSSALESIMGGLQQYRQLPVVDDHCRLVGWLDIDTLMARASMAQANKLTNDYDSPAVNQPADYLFVL